MYNRILTPVHQQIELMKSPPDYLNTSAWSVLFPWLKATKTCPLITGRPNLLTLPIVVISCDWQPLDTQVDIRQ